MSAGRSTAPRGSARAATATLPVSWAAALAGSGSRSAARRRARRRTLPDHGGGDLRHRLAVLDRLGVDLVGAHGRDHVHHLLHDLDVARLQAALEQAADAFLGGEADDRLAGRGRLRVDVLAHGEEAGGVREAGELEAPELRHLAVAG